MSETGQLAILCTLTLVLGIAGIFLLGAVQNFTEGDVVWDRYEAVFYHNGSFEERISTEIKTGQSYRMIFRYWDDPLSFNSLSTPYIQFVDADGPPGTYTYAKDYRGEVRVESATSSAILPQIAQVAFPNEVGAYNPAYYPFGTYTLTGKYILHPPIQFDEVASHLNLKLFRGDHPRIR